jgi:hypothetical protein
MATYPPPGYNSLIIEILADSSKKLPALTEEDSVLTPIQIRALPVQGKTIPDYFWLR